MIICSCNNITEKDIEEDPELSSIVGTCCGGCVAQEGGKYHE
jgi:bacterioferritin-associated ferredoxin